MVNNFFFFFYIHKIKNVFLVNHDIKEFIVIWVFFKRSAQKRLCSSTDTVVKSCVPEGAMIVIFTSRLELISIYHPI